MAYYLTAPSHYLNQCGFIISGIEIYKRYLSHLSLTFAWKVSEFLSYFPGGWVTYNPTDTLYQILKVFSVHSFFLSRWIRSTFYTEHGRCFSQPRFECLYSTRQCTDINHTNQRKIWKQNKYFLRITCLDIYFKTVWPLPQRPPENACKY